MSRLRQQYPQNYRSSGNISSEFESVIRYLNAAELGNKTIGELLSVLFDGNGVFTGPVDLRRNLDGTIEYRVGEYDDDDTGWTALATADELRGAAGVNVGEIGGPVIFGRHDVVPAAAATDVTYAHEDGDELLVWIDGLLQREGAGQDYTSDPATNTITFSAAFTGAETVSVAKIRASAISGFQRSDIETVATQSVFAFVHDADAQLNVYLNGILQRPGGAHDYINDPATNTITFNSSVTAGNTVTIITVESIAAQTVTGLMMEANFTDPATGLIRLNTIDVPDSGLTSAKVAGLPAALATMASMTASASTPSSPATGDLWLDTSQAPNQLKFYDGTQWLRTSLENALPTFSSSSAGQVLHVNGTGTALEFKAVDFSSLLAKTSRGAANGVASLDANGRLPGAQLPSVLGADTIYDLQASPANGGVTSKRIFKQQLQITGVAVQTGAGTCDVQIALNGVGTGATYAASTVTNTITLGTPISVDSSSAPVGIGFIISNVSSAADLEVMLAVSVVNQ